MKNHQFLIFTSYFLIIEFLVYKLQYLFIIWMEPLYVLFFSEPGHLSFSVSAGVRFYFFNGQFQ